MACIGLRITTKSPLLLSAAPPARNIIETLDFIPGNTIRGLLAQRYIAQGGDRRGEDFRRLFLSEETRFGFAYVEGSVPIPLSARTCKYYRGFSADGGHGVIDLLQSGEKAIRCAKPKCDHPVDRLGGYYDPVRYKQIVVRKRLITRTGIDSVRGTAKSGQLYSHRVVEEGQSFMANIEVPDYLKRAMCELIDDVFIAGIGRGRSRGQGWVEVRRQDPLDMPIAGLAGDRFDRFVKKGLAVTLLTDCIFHDSYLRDCTSPSPFHLKGLGIRPEEWEDLPRLAFADTRFVFGFDGEPLQLPRVARLAVKAGSVFFFQAKSGIEPTIPKGIGTGWIGDKISEGFGLALLWHQFHYLQDKEWSNE